MGITKAKAQNKAQCYKTKNPAQGWVFANSET
ncbi:hypothetical protein N482_00930 [Pseudoalteromonas luteoviolacea NCIMB 1942]|uniref:Uncharacterized protein n=1 Tax=Pseudoalteromonas luteoviolacea NCIMB 1942 TaxID=1365253 RepID=A0A167ETY3_9GAMM|nr:hypothetical protein N482_00930 [Pseudoalteromonas luteoviolacea NCIMB 1942]